MQSNASLSPSQARNGCREFSVGSLVSYHIDFFNPFEAHRLGANAGEIEPASISALHPRKKARNAQHGWETWLLTPCDHGEQEKCGPFH